MCRGSRIRTTAKAVDAEDGRRVSPRCWKDTAVEPHSVSPKHFRKAKTGVQVDHGQEDSGPQT